MCDYCVGQVGVFLLLRVCTVLVLLGAQRHCNFGSLYLDAHGEVCICQTVSTATTLSVKSVMLSPAAKQFINHSHHS